MSAVRDVRALRVTLAVPAPALRTEGPVSVLEDGAVFRVSVGVREFDVPAAEAFTVGSPYAL